MDRTSEHPEFWSERYSTGRTPWDQKGVPQALFEYLKVTPPLGAVLIPGCGSGYEVATFASFGWEPTAIDFSMPAVDRARSLLGSLGARVRCADFFRDEFGGPFELVYERTFLCSLPPERWRDYVERTVRLLKPKGKIAGLFVYGTEAEPPPFPLTAETATALFANFELIDDRLIPPGQSLPLFAGRERWQVWRLKIAPSTLRLGSEHLGIDRQQSR